MCVCFNGKCVVFDFNFVCLPILEGSLLIAFSRTSTRGLRAVQVMQLDM